MAHFDVLDPKTNVFGHYFLEASAGTGKTFAIENIVPRLLLESESPIEIGEILVVTFTRAATRELKSRIYQNLLKIASSLEAKEGGPKYLDVFRLKGGETLYAAKRRIEEALCFFEKAQVFTLHGFCLQILQEFALEAQFVFGGKEEDLDQDQNLKRYIKDFLRKGVDPSVISPSQLRKVIKGSDQEIESFCKTLLDKLKGGEKIRSYPTAFENWALWNQAFQSLPTVSKQDLWHDFSLLAPRLSKSKKRILQADLFFSWVEKKSISFEEWDLFLRDSDCFLEAIQFESAYKKKGVHELGLICPGLFEELQKIFVPFFQTATDPSIAFLQLVSLAKVHYEKGRVDLAHFNPDDLIVKLQEALKEERFQEKVRLKYKAAIIDEFQDTDPLQWNIFETLFLKTKNPISVFYLVGDPKQSIYAFRRADVYLYLKVAKILGEKALAYLDTNFRSHPDLVESLNRLFSFDLPSRFMLLPQTKESLEVRQVKSSSLKVSSFLQKEELGRIHFFLMEEESSREKRCPKEETEEKKLFPAIAREMLRLQFELHFQFKQMAVLVKDRYQASRLQTFLKKKGIPCFMQKTLDISTSIAYEGIKELLTVLEKPFHLSSVKKFLGGSLMGLSSRDLEGFWDNEWLQKTREYFTKERSSFRFKGFGVFFQEFLESNSRIEGKSIAQELLSRRDSDLYFELRQLCQILLERCPKGIYDFRVLLQFLEEMKKLPRDSELLISFSEEEEDQVQVMTLHKSKGLEFEIVFALGVCSRHKTQDEFLWIKKENGREMGVVSEEKEEFLLYMQELDAEKLRQLYVALTRAKERVYIPMVFSKNPSEVSLGSAAPIELLMGSRGLLDYSFEDVYRKISSDSLNSVLLHIKKLQEKGFFSYEVIGEAFEAEEIFYKPSLQVELVKPPVFSRMFSSSSLLSFSSLVRDKKEEKEISILEKNGLDLPLGAETGTIIHSILELVCKADLHRKKDLSIQEVVEKECKGSCLEGYESMLVKMVEEVMQTEIRTENEVFTLEQISSEDMQLEMEFLYPIKDSLLKGFIDLVFRFQGKYYILDWKSNFLGSEKDSYSFEKMKDCMEQNDYFLQASIYANALKKYLALFEKKPFEKVFGGVIYFFLRGPSSYFFYPSLEEPSLCKL